MMKAEYAGISMYSSTRREYRWVLGTRKYGADDVRGAPTSDHWLRAFGVVKSEYIKAECIEKQVPCASGHS
jgi:hypothetical protein